MICQTRPHAANLSIWLTSCILLAASVRGFITIQNGEFVDEDCKPFHFNGYNSWQILENAAGVVGDRTGVTDQFDAAVANGFNVVRIFGFGTQQGFALQSSKGGYNQAAWDALDYVINEAKQRSLRLVIALADNWNTDSNTDNRFAYVNYSPSTGGDVDKFYSDSGAQKAYQAHLAAVTAHVNPLTKLAYKNEPTIVSWNLINEPRCDSGDCWEEMQAWIAMMAPYLKSVDPNHLVTVGEDGFYDVSQCNSGVNPASWASQVGQNFLPNHAVSGIDYASIHLWPDNWGQSDIDFARFWVTNHSANALTLQKPLIIEEFGKEINASVPDRNEFQRNAFYKLIYSQVEDSLDAGGPLKGIMFWRWDAVKLVDLNTAGSPGSSADTIDSNSAEFTTIIKPFSQRVGQLKAATVSGCSASGNGTVAAASISDSSSSGPGPDSFVTPTPDTCCSGSCNALSGRLQGAVVQTTTASSSDACCSACKGNAKCNVWNYCFCDGGCVGGSVPKGTCELRNQANAFYPRSDSANSAGYLSGVPNVAKLTLPWECQPTKAGCTAQTVDTCSAADLQASLTCPSAACNASQVNLGGGDVLTIDTNADVGSKPVNSAADCCAACAGRSGCAVWTFCPLVSGCDQGCQDYVSTAKAGTANPPFGPNGGCVGNAFPYKACTLKTQPGGFSNATVYASGAGQPWVSGKPAQ